MKFDLYPQGFQAFMSALASSSTLVNKKSLFMLGDEQDAQAMLRAVNEGFIEASTTDADEATVYCVKGVFKKEDCYIVLYYDNERLCRTYEVGRLKKGEKQCFVSAMAADDIYYCTSNHKNDVIDMIGEFYDFGVEALYMSNAQVRSRRTLVA